MSNEHHLNELLAYSSFYINNSRLNNIKKIICNFYSIDDIIKSKKMLLSLCDSSLESYCERKTTNKRTSSEVHINNIFDALLKLDSLNQITSFVAKDLNQVPNRMPEKLNLISIVNRLSKLEDRQIENVNLIIKHDNDIKSLNFHENIIKIKDELLKIGNRIDSIQCMKDKTTEEIQKLTDILETQRNDLEEKYVSFKNKPCKAFN